MTKIWRSASQEMVSRLREFCFQTSWYRKKKRKEKSLWNRETRKGKKKILLFWCLHKPLYAAVISRVYEICNLFIKKKNSHAASAAQPKRRHLPFTQVRWSSFWIYEGGTLSVWENSCALRHWSPPARASSGSKSCSDTCRCELKAKGCYHAENYRKPFGWGGNDHNKRLTMYSRSGRPFALCWCVGVQWWSGKQVVGWPLTKVSNGSEVQL